MAQRQLERLKRVYSIDSLTLFVGSAHNFKSAIKVAFRRCLWFSEPNKDFFDRWV